MRAIRSALVLLPVVSLLGCSYKLKSSSSTKPTVKEETITYCNADQTFVIHGTALSPMVLNGATKHPDVAMPKVCLTEVKDEAGNAVAGAKPICLKQSDVQWVSQQEIRITLHPGYGLAAGDYDITVTNPDGTKAQGVVHLHVLPGQMLVLWSDPGIVYNGISSQPTIYGSNLENITEIDIRDPNDFNNPTVLCEPTDAGTLGACTPATIAGNQSKNAWQATVLKDQKTATYDVVVKAANGCQAELAQGLKVVDTVDPNLITACTGPVAPGTPCGIDPTFGWNKETTPVTVTGAGFQAIPRVYLFPNSGNGIATALSSITLTGDTQLTAVVPKGLNPEGYNVVVVNPDGKVGVLKDLPGATGGAGAFFVTANAPPVVDSVSPLYISNQAPTTVTVDGSGFDPALTVTMLCKPTATVPVAGITVGGPTTFNATINAANVPAGTVCLMYVTNPDNSYYVFSAIAISNPAQNLSPMIAASDMTEARRAPAVAPGRATHSARFIYAIGGDSGTTGGALASVESTKMDVYGEPGNWFPQPVSLPGPRTLSAVTRIGEFLYLVGGNDGAAPTNTALRAEVLQPQQAPQVNDIGARLGKGTPPDGIPAGLWYYRVSAVMQDSYATNPGGETLASDPIVIDIRQRTDTIAPTLYWTSVPNAKQYRVYRNPTGALSENVDSVGLLATVDAATAYYEDTNAKPPGGEKPRPLGATGNWFALPSLGTAREALAVAAGADPADATKMYLYALGGRGPGALASTEMLAITITQENTTAGTIESHQVATWAAGANLSAPRSELSGYSMTHQLATQIAVGDTWIYAAGGAESTNVDAAKIPAGGVLAWSVPAPKAMSPQRQGYAGVPGAGFLFAFGGANTGGTDDGIVAAQINTVPPDVVNWNANGTYHLTVPRYYAGGTLESAFIYLVGGLSNGVATAKTERTVL